MTKYLTYKVRSLLLYPELLGWAVFFVLFWVIMWVYVFGKSVLSYRGEPWYTDAVKGYLSLAYASLGLISLGSVATGLTSGIQHASKSIRFAVKFTRLNPRRFFLEDLAASLAVLLIVDAVIIASTLLLGWQRFGVLALPENPWGVFADLLALGVLFYELSLVLGYLVVALGNPRLTSLMSMIPLIISFIAYGSIFTDIGDLVAYACPINPFMNLVFYHGTGIVPKGSGLLPWLIKAYREGATSNLTITSMVLAGVLWILVFAILFIVLVRKARGLPIEALRTI